MLLIEYMVLENLSSKFHSPSVLDVKMGTRQHGDDACPEKVIKHKHTCANSTSGSLGIRLAGMQVTRGQSAWLGNQGRTGVQSF